MQKQYIYPQNMRTQAKLWFWNLKDVIILAIALTISVVSWAKLGFILPAALTLGYAFLSIRMDEYSVLDGGTLYPHSNTLNGRSAKMAKRKQSTAELIGISNFSRNGLQTKSQGEIVYFLVQPTNISVLSEQSVAIKIQHLMQLLSVQPDIEIICSDARENFEYNKLSLARRAEKETNLKVQLLLRKDMKFLDDIQLQMSTAREFMFAYRVKNANDQSFATLNRLEKQINDQGFDCRRATKDDIKRILSRYFGHMTEDAIDDVDGERMIKKWIIPD